MYKNVKSALTLDSHLQLQLILSERKAFLAANICKQHKLKEQTSSSSPAPPHQAAHYCVPPLHASVTYLRACHCPAPAPHLHPAPLTSQDMPPTFKTTTVNILKPLQRSQGVSACTNINLSIFLPCCFWSKGHMCSG